METARNPRTDADAGAAGRGAPERAPAAAFHGLRTRGAALLLAGLLGAAPDGSAAAGENFDAEAFHAYVEQAVAAWNATGLAVAVVRGEELLFARGYGVLELGSPEPVDADTLFAIGSTTKAMTAAALGILVDEGRLGWDDPVRRHLPEFAVKDPWVSRELTVRDLLTHRGGLPNTDVFWYGQDTDLGEMLARLRHVEPSYSMRAGFLYQNVMYALAGEVVKRVSGMPWHDFVDSGLLDRLGMERSAPLLALARRRANVASPHHFVDGETVVIENASVDSVAAAGSVWSSVREMSLWLRMLLASGVAADGTRILSEEVVEEMFRPQALVERAGFYPTVRLTKPKWVTYGLGWFQQDYDGRALDFHTGSIDGMVAIAGLLRDEGVGVYVLGNRDHVEVRHALMLRALDALVGSPFRDWSAELLALYGELAEAQAKAREQARAGRVADTGPSLDLAAYAGTYEHELGGAAAVNAGDNGLRLDYGPGLRGPLSHWHHDTFEVRWEARWRGEALISFRLDAAGRPAGLRIGETEFRRVR